MAEVRGIDISNHQGVIDWGQVKNAGIEFAFIKATQGINFHDQHFAYNWQQAANHGIIRGAYHFMEPYNNPDARAEADFFWEVINSFEPIPGDMYVLDAETTSTSYDGDYGNWCLYWAQIIESYLNVKPLIYTSPSYINRLNLTNPELGDFGLWLASWIINPNTVTQAKIPSAPDPWNLTAFWQYTDKGRVPGVSTLCDLNLFNGTKEQMMLYGWQQKEPQPQPQIDVAAIEAHLDDIFTHTVLINAKTKAIDESLEEIRKLLHLS